MQDEIKNAVEWSKKFRANFKDEISQVELKIANEMLLIFETLAQSYLDIKVFPKKCLEGNEIDFPTYNLEKWKCVDCKKEQNIFAEGYNQALHDCRFALLKKVEGLEGIIAEFTGFDSVRDRLAKSIRAHILGK